MNIKLPLFYFILFLSITTVCGQGKQQNLFNYPNSVEYANYLYNNGDYKLATSEFKRVLFMSPSNLDAAIKISDCYIRSGEFKSGINYTNSLNDQVILNDTLLLLRGKLLLLNQDFYIHDSWLNKQNLEPDAELFLKISSAMFQKKWELANQYAQDVNSSSELYHLLPIVNNTTGVKYKNPALSAAMSAIIPGSGKAYSGYWKDGFFSLLFVGVSIWQSYNGFHRDGINSKYGWIMAGIGISFYTGNVYGGAKAAGKRNYETNHQIIHEYEKAFINSYSRY